MKKPRPLYVGGFYSQRSFSGDTRAKANFEYRQKAGMNKKLFLEPRSTVRKKLHIFLRALCGNNVPFTESFYLGKRGTVLEAHAAK